MAETRGPHFGGCRGFSERQHGDVHRTGCYVSDRLPRHTPASQGSACDLTRREHAISALGRHGSLLLASAHNILTSIQFIRLNDIEMFQLVSESLSEYRCLCFGKKVPFSTWIDVASGAAF